MTKKHTPLNLKGKTLRQVGTNTLKGKWKHVGNGVHINTATGQRVQEK